MSVSPFTSKSTYMLSVPSSPGDTITIRKLAPKHLAKAQQASQAAAVEAIKALGGANAIKEIRGLSEKEADVAVAISDPLASYDRTSLMVSGVIDWSFDEPLTPTSLEDLDEETADWLAREILRLTKPSLFVPAPAGATTAERAAVLTEAEEAARKNG